MRRGNDRSLCFAMLHCGKIMESPGGIRLPQGMTIPKSTKDSMTNLTVFAADFEGEAIRLNEKGQFSVFDVLVSFGVADKKQNAQVVYNRIVASNSEVSTFCSNFKFPGRGQRDTPVADEEGVYQILMLCPGKRGAEFRSWAAKIVRERREEESNPELAYTRGRQRAVNVWRKQGKTDEDIALQLKGIEARCHLTDTLKSHGVKEGWQYGAITNEIYLELFGQKASELKESRGLAKSDRLKDHLSRVESAANFFTEVLASEDIKAKDLNGFSSCRDATKSAAHKVKSILN